eukprot:m.424307 g.424307  ORF g.424307 m.424307 type:complete len:126 (+) comp46049_c0_seq1:294-671(+)
MSCSGQSLKSTRTATHFSELSLVGSFFSSDSLNLNSWHHRGSRRSTRRYLASHSDTPHQALGKSKSILAGAFDRYRGIFFPTHRSVTTAARGVLKEVVGLVVTVRDVSPTLTLKTSENYTLVARR